MKHSGLRRQVNGRSPQAKQGQRGLTLVELLVAMAISTVIAIAAIAALIVSRTGLTSVDASSQLRDSARFATDIIQRLGVQSGYQDVLYAATTRSTNTVGVATNPDPNISGFNNAMADATDPLNTTAAWGTGAVGAGSDILILRYQTGETFPGSGVSDKTMIDCNGYPDTTIPVDRDDRMVSILHVQVSLGEPTLMCTYVASGGGFASPTPLVQGVENFQVLYGTDGVIPNTAPTGTGTDSVADRYLRADQMVVPGDAVGTNANWRRVRSLRIGMVIRGPVGSAQDPATITYYPFGLAKNSSSGTAGSAMSSSANDPGTVFAPTADGRMRQVVTFTVHLRNEQGL